ncbi:uncharacterized protein ATC70_004154 [Mucor velutinosus]|uniref:Uncharacterized protein n=1 Tax=Mucor velutinosus TaxID=708070 RepID=A0AAN7DRR0_9FUNG|nr:hypothetical protein ATC70_004154 [Mucor velutinosus]
MSYIIAPGEKPQDYYDTEVLDTPMPDDRDDEPATNGKRRVSTAHIEFDGILQSTQAKFAYDELVSACADFLGNASAVDNDVIRFAESILAVVGSPTTLDTAEVKRRLEQVLPTSHAFRHHRGMTLSDEDCTVLCSLADRVINTPLGQESNVDIVDNDEIEQEQQRHDSSDVYYIRHDEAPAKFQESLPKQLPSFVEANAEIGERDTIEYDMDVTPYDSEVDDDPPIRMRA